MLVHLSVHNYAIVEHLDLELATGMSVITGETGAGKSIMLDALGLTLGDRADSGAVRPGADKADILASFDVSAIAEARDWLAERDLEQDGPCILRRVITAEGRSRAYINGTPCPLGDLKSLGELLIDIHSQHEHQSLLKSETHRRLLDEYAGCQELARQVQLAAQRWKQTSQELERLSRSGDEQRARHQLLSYQLEELENLSLGENELESLEQEQKTLSNAESLLAACRQVVEMCSESDAGNVLSALNASLNRLTSFSGQPAALGEAVNLLSSAQIQVEEAIGELNRFVDHFDADPNRQQQVEERLDVIYSLARKHRVQPAELADLQPKLESKHKINKLRKLLDELDEDYDRIYLDTPPALNFYTVSALIAANRCLIPFDCDSFSRQALYGLLQEIEELRDDHNEDLQVEGIVVNQFQPRASLPQQLLDELVAEELPVLPVYLMSSVKMRESHQACTPLIFLEPRHKLTQQFVELHGLLES